MTATNQIDIENEFTAKLIVHKNLSQEVIMTTVDKLTLCLMKNRDNITAKREWLTPLSIFLALLTTLVAAGFRRFIFDPDVWTAVYVLGCIISLIWLCRAGYTAWTLRSTNFVDSLVNELKAESKERGVQGSVN